MIHKEGSIFYDKHFEVTIPWEKWMIEWYIQSTLVCVEWYTRERRRKSAYFWQTFWYFLTHFLIGVGRVGPVVQALALYDNGWEPHQILPSVIGLKKKINCDQIYMEGMLVYEWTKPAFVCKEAIHRELSLGTDLFILLVYSCEKLSVTVFDGNILKESVMLYHVFCPLGNLLLFLSTYIVILWAFFNCIFFLVFQLFKQNLRLIRIWWLLPYVSRKWLECTSLMTESYYCSAKIRQLLYLYYSQLFCCKMWTFLK